MGDVGADGSGVPAGFAPDGIMAALPDINAAAAQSTLGAVMSPEQMADVDWGADGPPDLGPEFHTLLKKWGEPDSGPVLLGSDQNSGDVAPSAGTGTDSGNDAPAGSPTDDQTNTPVEVAGNVSAASGQGSGGAGEPPGNAMPAGVDWHFITGRETTTGQGYVPVDGDKHPLPGSGVTIATGFDLGQHSAADLRGLGLPESFITQVSPLLAPGANTQGLVGRSARDYLTAHPLTISPGQASQIDGAVANHNYDQVANAYNADQTTGTRFQDLPQEAQTAVMSVAHQYGTNLAGATPNFWNQVTSGQWQAAHDNLMDFGDDYKTRRHAEAALLMNSINSGSLPKAPGKQN